MSTDEPMHYEQVEALIAALSPERQEALKRVFQMILRTFTEDDVQGVLLLVEKEGYLTTMGLNATYYESARLVHLSHQIFSETAAAADEEVRH